ncbi:MAG: sigma-70 family RNA polymerase sigma factor [bacterium]|nr:sigma-70 family RNA polymerase sigma factor [bacterium]
MAISASASLKTREANLLERHRHGDTQAFGELYQQFESMVYNLALRMSGNPADAEDIAQETFIRAYRHLGKFKGRSSLKTWVFRIAVNCSNTRLRRRGRHLAQRVDDSESELERAADEGRSPEERAVATDLSASVRVGLEHLPSHYREAVLLRDFEDMNYSEIAEVLGVRIGTVRSRIARGREQLRRWLEVNV